MKEFILGTDWWTDCDDAVAGYTVVKGYACVDAQTGANYFTESPDGAHQYVIKKHDDAYYENLINALIVKNAKPL